MADAFISLNEFQATSNRVTNWGDLPTRTIYLIDEIKQKTILRDGKEVISNYAVLVNRDGERKNVWLTSVIERELEKYEIGGTDKIYIQSFGLKANKSGTKKYYDFDIVQQ